MYVSTTLGIVIFTTLVCGGLTEPILNRTGMRSSTKEEDDGDSGGGGTMMGSTVSGSSTQNSLHSSSGGADGAHGGALDAAEDAPVARTATSTSFIEMLSGVTNRIPYEVQYFSYLGDVHLVLYFLQSTSLIPFPFCPAFKFSRAREMCCDQPRPSSSSEQQRSRK